MSGHDEQKKPNPREKNNWKDTARKKTDEAVRKHDLDKDDEEFIKKAIEKAETAGELAKAIAEQWGKPGVFKKLFGETKAALKGAEVIISILITAVEAGPCPWVSIIVARIQTLQKDSLTDGNFKLYDMLERLRLKYIPHVDRCNRTANGPDRPKDINLASVHELIHAGVPEITANRIVQEISVAYLHTPNELLRIPETTYATIALLLERGFYFGHSGREEVSQRH
jgi:hypothetical protein